MTVGPSAVMEDVGQSACAELIAKNQVISVSNHLGEHETTVEIRPFQHSKICQRESRMFLFHES